MKLGGVIYLQSIADNWMRGKARSNPHMFYQLCGDKYLTRVVLGTTNWGEVDENVGKETEQQLAKTFWNTVTGSGSTSLRFDQTKGSAQAFLDAILGQLEFGEKTMILYSFLLLSLQ